MRRALALLAAGGVALAAVVLGTLVAGTFAAPPAAAAPARQAGGETIRGVLNNEKDESGKQVRQPVAGVVVVVKQGGTEVGKATSDERGRWQVKVPGPGDYQVSVDPDSFPKGVTLTDAKRGTIKVRVNPGQQRGVVFAFGAARESGSGGLGRVAQLFVEGLRFGLIMALGALGLSMIYGTTGLTNFAHGELVTFGALVAFFFNVTRGLNLLVAAVLAVVVAGGFGWANDALLWRPLRRRGTGLIAMMIVSIGLALFLRYFYLFLFGGSTRSYVTSASQHSLALGPISLTTADVLSMALAVVVLVAVSLALIRTRMGKATRAVADNPALAAASGIDVDRVISVVWIVGAALAGLAGVLLGIAQQINFQMGFQILLLIFAAVTLGGLGTAWGALVGSLVVGVFIQLSTLVIPPELKNVGVLAVLIIILLVRPQGILGRTERVG